MRRSPLRSFLSLAACLGAWVLLAGTALAYLQVNVRRDVVELQDGTKVECIVLVETKRGVLVVVKDPDKAEGVVQKLIPAADVKKITSGSDEGQIKGLKTEAELARKVVQGSGYRKEGKDPTLLPPVAPTGPITPALAPVTNATGEQPAANTPSKPAASKLTPQQVAGAYFSRFPTLQMAVETFVGGTDMVAPLIQQARDGDITAREPLEGFLGLFLLSKPPAPERQPGTRSKPAPGTISKPAPPPQTTTPPQQSPPILPNTKK